MCWGGVLDALDVRRVETFRTRLDLELYLLTLGERLEPVHHDRREVDEHILAAFLFNEAIPLRVIEPLHFPSGHASCLLRGEPSPCGFAQGANRPRFAAIYIDAACKFVKRKLCPATRYRSKPIYSVPETNEVSG